MIQRFLSRLQTAFWQQVMTLFSGSLIAQALLIAAVPVLSRLYEPGEFGIAAVFFATVIVFAVVINGGYETAIMLPEQQEDALNLVRISVRIALVGSVGLLAVSGIAGEWLLGLNQSEALSPWHLLIPLSLMLEGIQQPLRTLLNRQRHYRLLAISRIIRAAFQVGLSVGLALLGWGFQGLILGFVSGQISSTIVLIAGTTVLNRQALFSSGKLKAVARSYSDFPRYAILSTWLNTLAKQLPFFLLVAYFSEDISGYYSHAEKVLLLPVALIGMSVSSVFYEHATRAHQAKGRALAQLTLRTFWQMAIIGLPLLIVMIAAGPWLFGFVLGEKWIPAGVYAQRLAPWAYLLIIGMPLSFLTDVLRKLPVFLYFNLGLFLVSGVTLWYGGTYLTELATITLFGAGAACVSAVQIGYLLWLGMRENEGD